MNWLCLPRPRNRPTDRTPIMRRRRMCDLEVLEDRTLLSTTFVVDSISNNPDLPGTLPYAVKLANASVGARDVTITFDPTVFDKPQTIVLAHTLILTSIWDRSVIDGPGASELTISGDHKVGVFETTKGSWATLNGLTIADGYKRSGGGGVANLYGQMNLNDCVITRNSGNVFGGGVSSYAANGIGGLRINDCTIVGNSTRGADIGGGGVYSEGSRPTSITNSTIANNTASHGAGIYNYGTTLSVVNSTIVDNTSRDAGGGLYSEPHNQLPHTISLNNTIVALNHRADGAPDDIAGRAVVGSFNLIGMGGTGGLTNLNGNQVDVADPMLAPLHNYGGSTPTIAVLPGSPAMGRGSASIPGVSVPSTDQRGVERPSNSIDIGAFQDRGYVISTVPTSSPQRAAANSPFEHPLGVVVSSPFGEPVNGGRVFYSAPSSGASAVFSSDQARIVDGHASVTATANGIGGQYDASVSARDVTSSARFLLENFTVKAITVYWNTRHTALRQSGPLGGVLLPEGRKNDLPWSLIDQFDIQFVKPFDVTSDDVTVSSAIGKDYGPVNVSGSQTRYDLKMTKAITQPDRVTIVIKSGGNVIFDGQIPVLFGDFNDDGVVTAADVAAIRDEREFRRPTIYGDVDGDGTVDPGDIFLAEKYLGARVP